MFDFFRGPYGQLMFNAAVPFFGCDSYTVIAEVNAIKVGTEKRKKEKQQQRGIRHSVDRKYFPNKAEELRSCSYHFFDGVLHL